MSTVNGPFISLILTVAHMHCRAYDSCDHLFVSTRLAGSWAHREPTRSRRMQARHVSSGFITDTVGIRPFCDFRGF